MSKYIKKNFKPLNLAREYDVMNKQGAVITAEQELAGLVNFDMIAKRCLHHLEEDWFFDCTLDALNDPDKSFTSEECLKIAETLEDVAARALKHAKEIREAKYLTYFEMPLEIQQKMEQALDEEARIATGRNK